MSQGNPTDETGTTQTFWPDGSIFETIDFDFETLRARFQQMAFLNKGLTISLTDRRDQHEGDEVASAEEEAQKLKLNTVGADSEGFKTVTYMYKNGLLDYVHFLNSSKKLDVINEEIIAFEEEDSERQMSLEVALQWTTSYKESVHTYANTINTHEGGTPVSYTHLTLPTNREM